MKDGYVTVGFDPFAETGVLTAIPSTDSQREMWLGIKLGDPEVCTANESVAITLQGKFDRKILQKSLQFLVDRHEALRATFSEDGEQMIIAETVKVNIFEGEKVGDQVLIPFVLENGPLFRFMLTKETDDSETLVVTFHHIICDGWSLALFIKELNLSYAAFSKGVPPLLPKADSFIDYATKLSFKKSALDYWKKEFEIIPEAIDLPLKSTRPELRTFGSKRVDVVFSKENLELIKNCSAKQGVSLVSFMLAGFSALITKLSGNSDVVVGLPSADQATKGLNFLVGHCVNLLPIRLKLDAGVSAKDFVRSVRDKLLDAYENQGITYGRILNELPSTELSSTRDPSRIPLVPFVFNIDSAVDREALRFDGEAKVSTRTVPRAYDNFELYINAVERSYGMEVECQYNTELFNEQMIVAWLKQYEDLLVLIAKDETTVLHEAEGKTAVFSGEIVDFSEIARELKNHSSVADCAVILWKEGKDQRLVAYVVPKSKSSVDLSDVRDHLRGKVEAQQIPQQVVELKEIPKTATGLVDQKKLPSPLRGGGIENNSPPKTATEVVIAEIWRNLLKVEKITVNDTFFRLGGHSLLAIKALSEINNKLGTKISPRHILLNSLKQIASHIDSLIK